jgi:hypothetical protein
MTDRSGVNITGDDDDDPAASPQRWDDVVAVFGRRGNDPGWCWCRRFLDPSEGTRRPTTSAWPTGTYGGRLAVGSMSDGAPRARMARYRSLREESPDMPRSPRLSPTR